LNSLTRLASQGRRSVQSRRSFGVVGEGRALARGRSSEARLCREQSESARESAAIDWNDRQQRRPRMVVLLDGHAALRRRRQMRPGWRRPRPTRWSGRPVDAHFASEVHRGMPPGHPSRWPIAAFNPSRLSETASHHALRRPAAERAQKLVDFSCSTGRSSFRYTR
jgi:hypothetical protein